MWEVQGVTGTFVWDITSLPRYDVILGMDWLALVNPQVDWVTRKITFRRQECFTLNPTQPDMEGVPAEYGEFSDVFCKKEADKLPPHRPYDCAIRLAEGAKLPAGRLYALTVPERQALREFLDENLAKGFIRPSSSPTAAPVFFVAKKTGDLRLVCDYRVLNKHTIRDRYPLPLISELLSRVQGAKVFTKLDLRGAYNLIRIREGDEWKMAFNTCFGCHEFRVMPFGLCNAPAVFQRFINDVFRDLIDQFVVIYLDDILIFSKDEREHRQHVKQVLHRLRANGLFAKASKCVFHVPEVEFLGHVVSGRELKMDPHKVDAVNSWQELKTKKDVQRFLGFANYYREFIPNFAKLTVPLTQLLRKKQPFVWGREAHDAFLQLKSSFQADNILIHPDVDKPFVVEADASSYALGAVLSQRDSSGTLRPCGFYSRQLTPFEQNYTIWEKELLAIKVAFEVWRHWLEGARHQIVVRSDHKNLEHLQTAKKLNQRQIRWALFFSRFNFKVQFVEGKANLRADALSRKPEFKTNEQVVCQTILPTASLCVVENEIGLHDQIIEAQKEDVWTQEQLMLLSAGNRTILPHCKIRMEYWYAGDRSMYRWGHSGWRLLEPTMTNPWLGILADLRPCSSSPGTTGGQRCGKTFFAFVIAALFASRVRRLLGALEGCCRLCLFLRDHGKLFPWISFLICLSLGVTHVFGWWWIYFLNWLILFLVRPFRRPLHWLYCLPNTFIVCTELLR
uniref:Reverse transcriptase domain-containing protein n=1 Tax=Anolis carolinensis TaxID=28377 RepID=A0A803TSC6_ANOCA